MSLARSPEGERVSKYRAIPTTIDGIRFASRAEGRRYQELRMLIKAGQITDLVLQPAFVLHVVNPATGEITVIGRYLADFQYDTPQGRVVEDVKGMLTPVYRLKKKHVEAEYGIQITEIRKVSR